MLSELSIRNIVLIDQLDLSFGDGLSVLTGETGAGKSILLDALGLALGSRADSGLVRHGVGQANVTATFELANPESVSTVLEEAGAVADGLKQEPLILRRVVARDGRSRAFINDEPVSAGLLRRVGDVLIEIQGQFDSRGLLDPASHRRFLDDFADHPDLGARVSETFAAWRNACDVYQRKRTALTEARTQEEYLRFALAELDALAPEIGEEAKLMQTRTILANAGQVLEAMGHALELVNGDGGAAESVAMAQRSLERVSDRAGDRIDEVLAALDRSSTEMQEIESALTRLAEDIESDSGRLDSIEDRLHGLRTVASKHGIEPDGLPQLHRDVAGKLDALVVGGGALAALETSRQMARDSYVAAAEKLSQSRVDAAMRLDQAVTAELCPLKFEKAVFMTMIEPLGEENWTAEGRDRIRFLVATNPGMPAGALNRVASGGELSRLLLALRVVLARVNPLPTLIFDEVDAGVGGAVAAAVGNHLQVLGEHLQVLVITHSPQVAARGKVHWRIAKVGTGEAAATMAALLDSTERREEIARMLSGSVITDAARAAADTLLHPD